MGILSLTLKFKKNFIPFLFCIMNVNLTAHAETQKTNAKWDPTVLGFESPQGGLLGDMYGLRPALENAGFHYSLAYVNEIAYNAAGGYNHDKEASYIDQVSLTFTQDLERYTGIPDAAIEGNIVNRNHDSNLRRDRLQDSRALRTDESQESWGGQSITRLGWLTFSRSFDDRKLHWRIGMMNKLQDFDQAIGCDFQTLNLCGGKSANSGWWYNWNSYYWGTVLKYDLTSELTAKIGVMEQNPEMGSRRRAWSLSSDGSKGFLLPMELEWRPMLFGKLPGIYNIGTQFTNSPQADLSEGKSGYPGAIDADGYREYHRSWYFSTAFNQQITQKDDDPQRGMSLFSSLAFSDQRSNYIRYSASSGIRYRGLFDLRPEDWIGAGVSYIKISNHYKGNLNYLNELNNVSDYSNPLYNPIPDHSVTAEVFYRFKITPWFELQPDLQYWYHPGGIKETQAAWVIGLKTSLNF